MVHCVDCVFRYGINLDSKMCNDRLIVEKTKHIGCSDGEEEISPG